MFQKRLLANVTFEEEKDDKFTNFKSEHGKTKTNVMTDELKNMMIELLQKRQRRRRDSDATRQTIHTSLNYAELWSRISSRDELVHVGQWLCEVECRAKGVGRFAHLVSSILSKRLLMSLRWEMGFQGLDQREPCRCQNSQIHRRLYSHTNQNDGQFV